MDLLIWYFGLQTGIIMGIIIGIWRKEFWRLLCIVTKRLYVRYGKEA